MNNIWKDLGLEVGKIIYDPNPELTLADKAAILTEGKIIEINQNPASPNAIY